MNRTVIKQLKLGYEEAFNKVYHQYMPLIKQICYFYMRDNNEAEDLTMQVFIKLWEHRTYLDPNKNFKYYLTQIAHNLCKDLLRQNKRKPIVLKNNHEIDLVLKNNTYQSDTQDDEILFKQVASLIDDDSYQMIIYKYVHNLKQREIAKMMGTTTSAVGNKIARALKKLKEEIKIEEE